MGNACDGLLIAFVTIPANVVIALLTSVHPPESFVMLRSVCGTIFVYVPTGRSLVTASKHKSLALLNVATVSDSSP